jgi:hypothetical protein
MKVFTGLILLTLSFIFLNSCHNTPASSTGSSSGSVIILQDSFDRPDSFTVGSNWAESEMGDVNKEAAASIIGNKLVCSGGYLGGGTVFGSVYITNMAFSSHKTTIPFHMDNSSYLAVKYYDSQIPGGNSYMIQIYPNVLGLIKYVTNAGSWLASTNYTFDATHKYLLIESYSDFTFSIDLRDTTAGKSTVLTVSNSLYQLFGTFFLGGGGHDGTNAYYTYIDSVTVEKP